jgi:hypothetical protein
VGIRKWCKSIQEMSKLVLVVTHSEQEVSKSVQVNFKKKEGIMSVQEVRKSVQKVSNAEEGISKSVRELSKPVYVASELEQEVSKTVLAEKGKVP